MLTQDRLLGLDHCKTASFTRTLSTVLVPLRNDKVIFAIFFLLFLVESAVMFMKIWEFVDSRKCVGGDKTGIPKKEKMRRKTRNGTRCLAIFSLGCFRYFVIFWFCQPFSLSHSYFCVPLATQHFLWWPNYMCTIRKTFQKIFHFLFGIYFKYIAHTHKDYTNSHTRCQHIQTCAYILYIF